MATDEEVAYALSDLQRLAHIPLHSIEQELQEARKHLKAADPEVPTAFGGGIFGDLGPQYVATFTMVKDLVDGTENNVGKTIDGVKELVKRRIATEVDAVETLYQAEVDTWK